VHKGTAPAGFVRDRYRTIYDMGLHENFYADYHKLGFTCTDCGENCGCAAHIYLCRLGGTEGLVP